MVRMYRSRSMSAAENRRYPERDLAGSIRPSASRNRILDVLMSGNSGRSWARTSPMPNWPPVSWALMRRPRVRARPEAAGATHSPGHLGRGGRGWRPRVRADVLTGQEQQPELADLHLVPADQLGLLDPLPVHVRAVEAAHIADGEPGAVPVELGVPPGDGHVVEEDVAVRVAARGGQLAVEPEPAARVGTAHDQEQRAARRQRAERRGVREQILAEIVLGPAQRDRRGGLAGRSPPGPPGEPGTRARPASRLRAVPARSAGSRSTSRTWPRRDSAGRTGRSRRVAWLRSASPGRTHHRLRATQPTVRETGQGGPCATRTARAVRAGYFRRDASATPPYHLRRAPAPCTHALPGPSPSPPRQAAARRANRDARFSHIRENRVGWRLSLA